MIFIIIFIRRKSYPFVRGLGSLGYNEEPMITNDHKLYERLGFLFYSICASGRKIEPIEWLRLKEVIRQYWATSGDVSAEASRTILIVLDFLVWKGESAEDAFTYFVEYYEDHPEIFTCEIKHRIAHTAGSAVHVLEGINQNEDSYLNQLHFLFTDEALVSQVYG